MKVNSDAVLMGVVAVGLGAVCRDESRWSSK